MDIDKLFQEEKNEATSQLEDLLFDNEDTINYFNGIDKKINGLLKSTDIKKINKASKKLSKRIEVLSSLKFMIFELEDEIPDNLQKEWDKLIRYITENMGLNEVDMFTNKLMVISKKIDVIKEQEKKIEQEINEESETIIAYDYNIKELVQKEIQRLKSKNQPLDLNRIDVSKVRDMSYLFSCSIFKGDISEWDVSKVINMEFMFEGSEFNGDISKWDVSNVTSMQNMFQESKFNIDISEWDISNVTNMEYMFEGSKFNRDISEWDVSNVENLYYMFSGTPMELSKKTPKWYK